MKMDSVFQLYVKEYTVTIGHGEDGNESRDGMWPAQLFEASIGMCIGGYIAKLWLNKASLAMI